MKNSCTNRKIGVCMKDAKPNTNKATVLMRKRTDSNNHAKSEKSTDKM